MTLVLSTISMTDRMKSRIQQEEQILLQKKQAQLLLLLLQQPHGKRLLEIPLLHV